MTGIFSANKTRFVFRAYRPGDRDEVIRMFVEHSLEFGRKVTAKEMSAILDRPGSDLERNFFLAERSGSIVGYLQLAPEVLADRMNLSGWTDPEFRRQGIMAGLLKLAVERTRAAGLSRIVTGVSQTNRIARTLLPHLGFTYVHRFLEMKIPVQTIPYQSLYRAGLGCRPMVPGEEQQVMELQNRVFDGHWGFPPYSMETFRYDINLNHRSPADIIVYPEEDRIIGYCWTEIYNCTDCNGTMMRGVIDMVGIEPAQRGKGLGEKLLLSGLAHLKSRKVKQVTLTVDSENRPARELYRKTGFTEYGSTLWYGLDTGCDSDR